MAGDVVRGPAADLDIGHQRRLGPAHVAAHLRRRRRLERRAVDAERLQLVPKVLGDAGGEARADAAGIFELALSVEAQHQRADRAPLRGGGHIADDDELASLHALRLEPGLAAAGAIAGALELGDDALEAEAAGMREHDVAARGEMLAQFQDVALVAGKQLRQRPLAVEQGCAGQVDAVQIQKIEEIVAKAVAAAFAQVRLQTGEVRRAPLRLHDDLAIEKRGDDGQGLERLLEARKLRGPVESAAGLELGPTGVDAREQPVAVELDLMHPAVTRRRLARERGKLRLDELRQCPPLAAFHLLLRFA